MRQIDRSPPQGERGAPPGGDAHTRPQSDAGAELLVVPVLALVASLCIETCSIQKHRTQLRSDGLLTRFGSFSQSAYGRSGVLDGWLSPGR